MLLSTVARHDYPQHWPTLVSELVSCVEAAGAAAAAAGASADAVALANLVHVRAASALQCVVKALCSRGATLAMRSLAADVPSLLSLASQFTVQCGAHIVDAVMRQRVAPDTRVLLLYEIGNKLARRLLKFPFVALGAANALFVDELERFTLLVDQLPQLRETQTTSVQQAVDGATYGAALRICVLSSKLAIECASLRDVDFAPYAAPYVRVCCVLLQNVLNIDAESNAIIRAMMLLSICVESSSIRTYVQSNFCRLCDDDVSVSTVA